MISQRQSHTHDRLTLGGGHEGSLGFLSTPVQVGNAVTSTVYMVTDQLICI